MVILLEALMLPGKCTSVAGETSFCHWENELPSKNYRIEVLTEIR